MSHAGLGSCVGCTYWYPTPLIAENIGQCRRHAPTKRGQSMTPGLNWVRAWLLTYGTDGCGDWVADE